MDDEELAREFVKIERDHQTGVRLLVREIRWKGSHTPTTTWTLATSLPGEATPSMVEAAMQEVLREERYFRVCTMCSRRQPVGWMQDSRTCRSCAEQRGGVVY